MMTNVECPGLPASWLNAWLAAVGLLALEPRLRLSWTCEPEPIAVLSTPSGENPLELAVNAWPSSSRIDAMPIAEHVEGLDAMQRKVPLEVFQQRAEFCRQKLHDDSWTLASTVTDLCVDTNNDKIRTVRHARLDPKGPGTTKWLHHRLSKSHKLVTDPSLQVNSTLHGHAKRIKDNGLGFDATRISALADSAHSTVDPVIEVLAFFGLKLLPMRGEGIEVKNSWTRNRFAARQRNWILDREQDSQLMTWPAWEQPLDLSGVDALLDLWADMIRFLVRGKRVSRTERSLIGIHAAWRTVAYKERGTSDTTVGFASARVEFDAIRR